MGTLAAVEDIRRSYEGPIESIVVTGEIDLSNVDSLDEALRGALSGESPSCLLDLSELTFMDSSVVHSLIRWSKEAQISVREALAIMIGGPDTEATRVLSAVGLMKRLPVFASRDAAMTALQFGRKPRPERPLRWLTDAELAAERDAAQASSDAATVRLDEAIAEQDTRRQDGGAAQDE